MSDAPPVVSSPSAPQPLGRLPFPPFVQLLALVTIVAFAAGLFRLPKAIGRGLDAERGKRDLAAGQYAKASAELRRVLDAYPEAEDVRLDYGEAALKAGERAEGIKALMWFEGKKVTKEQSDRLDRLTSNVGGGEE